MQLFNRKTIERHIQRAASPDQAKLDTLREWAATIKDGAIVQQKETALHGNFKQRIVCDVLGYTDFNDSGAWTVDVESQIGAGSVDLALGNFTPNDSDIIAPFELKGAKTKNLDAIMPGRAKSPVDQAWEYASNNVGSKWVLVSNYLEIRLYSYANGRQFDERFDLAKLHEPDEYQRFMLLLSADNLLSGRTANLLSESHAEDKDITDELYAVYKVLRSGLIDAVQSAKPDIDALEAIGVGQTILDRVLFIAFAEDNGLVPDNSLLNAFEHNDPYNPKPVWQNFLGLFSAIDEGSDELDIPRYNGGLFARDPIIRSLKIPDAICEGFKLLAEYDFASEVPVTILGRIFEQSISDIETLQKRARGEEVEEKKGKGTSGRQKRDGVVYTPDYVARFIVEQTLGTHCREIFDGVLGEYAAKGAKADDDPIKWKSAKAEKQAWQAYRDRITALRIVDPACGSGVFLVIAFDWLKAEIMRCNLALEGLGEASLFEPDSEILTNNLFGVDVNSESVEIAKLSLWIKTARRGKVLDSLDENLRVGDSLIEDSNYAYRDHGFEWKTAFPEIFADGGFDIVLGNPPYVRMELIKPMKPWLEKRYEVVSDRADLYAYFFERGLKLLKPGGRLGYISSATFFKTGSGEPLRNFLRKKAALETVVDFGDNQIFEGVTTFPAILTMQEGRSADSHELHFWNVNELVEGNFSDQFATNRRAFPQCDLKAKAWKLEPHGLRKLRAKVLLDRRTLREVFGSPLYGIKTGLNEAFRISDGTKRRLCARDPNSAKLLKPYLEGKDIKRWRTESRNLWLIYIPKGQIKIDHFPAIRDWLLPFRDRLEKRATKQEWFELQQAQDADAKRLKEGKVIYSRFADKPNFAFTADEWFINDAPYFIPTNDLFLAALLNSNVSWFVLSSASTLLRGGFVQLLGRYVEALPIPDATPDQMVALGALAEAAQAAAEGRYKLQQSVARRIPDLIADPAKAKLSNKLKNWWKLPDFASFQKEVKKTLKTEIPLKERNDWQDMLSEARDEISELTAEIARLEGEINTQVYALFDLTSDEIKLLEANI